MPRPHSIAASICVGELTPGITGTPRSRQKETTFGLNPGETMNFAPAPIAFFACSVERTVPAPTTISGIPSARVRIASSAAAVRKVISASGKPPARSAFPREGASAAFSILTTGTIP